jgi:hypothetical protein
MIPRFVPTSHRNHVQSLLARFVACVAKPSQALLLGASLALACSASTALAWDGAGHRMITRVALGGLREELPAWLKDEQTALACSDMSQQPDRWRSVRVPQLTHLNNPDHYIDIDDLPQLGMTLRTMPQLRHEYVKLISLARAKPDFAGAPINEAKDVAKTDEYPGFLPIATMETYGKVVGAMKSVRTLELLHKQSPTSAAREAQIEAAKWNARVHIGQLAHYAGDTSQPLHTTKHHHGWIGENPNNYTTDRGIHSYIDGDILKLHNITDADLIAKATFDKDLDRDDLWGETLSAIERSFAQVEPLYALHKSGELQQEKGKAFIVERLADSASQLSALIEAAWMEAAPTPKEVEDMARFEESTKQGKTPARTADESKKPSGQKPEAKPAEVKPAGS